MLTTTVTFGLLFGLQVVEIVLWGVFLRIGLRWTRAESERVTRRRIAVVTGLVFLQSFLVMTGILFWLPERVALNQSEEIRRALLIFGLQLAAVVIVPCTIIYTFFKLGVWRAVKAWLPTLIPRVLLSLVAWFGVRAYVAECFVTTTSNAMAPTLLGLHVRDVCSQCGAACYGSLDIVDERMASMPPGELICDNFHIDPGVDVSDAVHPADHVMTAKYLQPRRWDLLVFRPPFDPETQFVMRLVGLPGETIVIKDGQVFADGNVLTPPEELEGITYTSGLPEEQRWPEDFWGTEQQPAPLANDEYFVLGDFTTRSRDSRLWPENNTGHPPYALPASHIDGVATHIYWPPPRWRILR